VTKLRRVGRIETGIVYQQTVSAEDEKAPQGALVPVSEEADHE
jgi:hypothetical protein